MISYQCIYILVYELHIVCTHRYMFFKCVIVPIVIPFTGNTLYLCSTVMVFIIILMRNAFRSHSLWMPVVTLPYAHWMNL